MEQGVNLDQPVKVQSSRHGIVHSCTRGGMPFVCLRHSVISADWLSSEIHDIPENKQINKTKHIHIQVGYFVIILIKSAAAGSLIK